MKSLVVIPARLASTRLPNKMLLRATGKTLIQHTYEAASRAASPSGVIVATDHDDIAATVRSFGGRAEMTDPQARSGTDRVAEIARNRPEIDIFVNVQGDEPEIRGESIDQTIELLTATPAASMSTLATPIRNKQQLHDPACVKVVFDGNQRALYFSRSPIPHAREWDDALLESNPPHFFQHLGIYAYRRDFLLQLATLPQSNLEQLEKLEQLRVLHFGHQILVGVVDEPSIGIDTPADYDAFVRRFRNC
jgi:3-deoxy-manno-octulosonate cytidylyltransferase (CMP-KDO synthetase)